MKMWNPKQNLVSQTLCFSASSYLQADVALKYAAFGFVDEEVYLTCFF